MLRVRVRVGVRIRFGVGVRVGVRVGIGVRVRVGVRVTPRFHQRGKECRRSLINIKIAVRPDAVRIAKQVNTTTSWTWFESSNRVWLLDAF